MKAIEGLLAEKGILNEEEIHGREKLLVDESLADAEKAMQEQAQKELLQKLASHEGPVQ